MVDNKKKLAFYLFSFFLLVICIIVFIDLFLITQNRTKTFKFNPNSSYWPTNGWKYSSPEKQGMDSKMLVKLFDEINKKSIQTKFRHKILSKLTKETIKDKILIGNMLITRNGYIVVDAYPSYMLKDALRPIYSSTKSITSALFGIAFNKQYIKDIDQSVLDFFPKLQIEDKNEKKAITIRHLLSMSSGLEWPEWKKKYSNPDNPVYKMDSSNDFVRFILSKPVIETPGEKFNYNSGCSHLIGCIINQSTNGDLSGFAKEHLFKPLGISNYVWRTDPSGVPKAGGGLVMNAYDMAKFGYLYLKGGFWDGQQIIPEKWVEESTKKHMDIPGFPGWFFGKYGYQWYINSFGFNSLGVKGQYIFVVPEQEMVIVFTSELAGYELFDPIFFVKDFILPSVKSKGPIPENPEGLQILKKRIKAF